MILLKKIVDQKKQKTHSPEVDDEAVDKEISDYSKKAGDRIAKIKYEYHEERRAKEAASRESKEAIARLTNFNV